MRTSLAEVCLQSPLTTDQAARPCRSALHDDAPISRKLKEAPSPNVRVFHKAIITEVAHQLRRCGRGELDPAHTAALLVHVADAQLHRVLLCRSGDPEDLVRALLAMAEAVTV